ncbi:PilW family protein [Marinilactibacillus psychrotolerans]|uniref:PilW family protein n=1 Tax=Marinilactibacillus psychrotolerans TaxID=191770 RepID=UPI003887361F
MIKFKKSENGFTLIELLATLAILSLVIILAGSIHIFGQKQFIQQSEQVSQINDLRYIMASIERDIRQTPKTEIEFEESLIVGDATYSHLGATLYKNSEILSDQISSFDVTLSEDKIDISLSSTMNGKKDQEVVSTIIYFRR